jgi:hypothetical protein
LYFGDIYGSITGDSYGDHVSDEEAYRVLNEMYPEDFHSPFVTKIIRAYRFVSRVLMPFLIYEKWNRPRQYMKGKHYPPSTLSQSELTAILTANKDDTLPF